MSTPCQIGIIRANGRVKSIYCHNNGGSSHIRKILTEAYASTEAVEALLKLGDISVLGRKLAPGPGTHSVEQPQPDVTVAYVRDDERPKAENKPYTDRNVTAFTKMYADRHCYLYDVRSGTWLHAGPYSDFNPLETSDNGKGAVQNGT